MTLIICLALYKLPGSNPLGIFAPQETPNLVSMGIKTLVPDKLVTVTSFSFLSLIDQSFDKNLGKLAF
jgi:hypothetical protein